MPRFVTDASVTLPWYFEDEANLKSLPITIEPPSTAVRPEILALAERYRLTTYDAGYLELALRFGWPLATLDQELRRAAKQAGIGAPLQS
jgi:predicted nucleic acid-binding protein